MKIYQLNKIAMIGSLLTTSLAFAGGDYPAADFQPKVLYSAEASSSSVAAAPAASASVEQDPNYPATNFQPKVLFNDAGYVHSAAAPGVPVAAKSVGSSASAPAASASSEVVHGEKEGSSNNIIGLAVLAAIGFFLYSKKSGKAAAGSSVSSSYADADANGGSTGVERYLEKQGMKKTGVDKYLEKQTSNPATGVAKYMAKQVIRDREAAAAKVTGVEKYLRDNG